MFPRRYLSLNHMAKSHNASIIEEFEDQLANVSGNCMDIGCGPGDITKKLLLPALGKNAKIVAVDISPEMIEVAKELHSDERITFDVLDIQTKNLPQKHISNYELVTSFNALHWCYDTKLTYENIYKVLRPNGTFLLLLICHHTTMDILSELINTPTYKPYFQDAKGYISPFCFDAKPQHKIKKELREIGFEVLHSSHRKYFFTFKCAEDKMVMLNSLFDGLFKNLPKDVLEKLKADFHTEDKNRRVFHRDQTGEEKICDHYTLLLAYAKKRV